MKAEVIATLGVPVEISDPGPHDDPELMATDAARDAIGLAAKFSPEYSVTLEDE